VVWSVSPEAGPGAGDAFRESEVLLTVVGGEVVLRR